MRYLMAFFFFFLYMGDDLGINLGLVPGVSAKNLLLYVIFAGIAVEAAVARNRDFELPSIVIPFVLLVLYALLSWIVLAFVVSNPHYSMSASGIALKSALIDQLVTFLIFFYGMSRLGDAVWLMRATIWIVVLGNFITIVDTFNVPNLGILDTPRKAGRFEGFLGQPNSYGQFLALFVPGSVVLLSSNRGYVRLLAAIGALSTIVALVLTGSRGAYTGLLVGSIVAAVFLRRYIPTRVVVRAGAAAMFVVAVVIAVTFITGYAEVYVERVTNVGGGSHAVTSGRSTIWATLLRPMVESPLSFLTGFGFHAYETGRFFRSPHNMYLLYLYNLGAIGVVLFLSVFARILVIARRALRPAFGEEEGKLLFALIFGLLGFLIAIVFSEYNTSAYLLWAYMGVGMRVAVNSLADQAMPRTDAPMPVMHHQGGPIRAANYQSSRHS